MFSISEVFAFCVLFFFFFSKIDLKREEKRPDLNYEEQFYLFPKKEDFFGAKIALLPHFFCSTFTFYFVPESVS